MKVGEPVRGSLMYPVYVDNILMVPAKTVVTDSVVALTPDHSRRIHARLRFDFTPYRIPVVRFDGLLMPDGMAVPLKMGLATNGTPVYRVVAPPPRTGGLISRQLAVLKQAALDRIHVVTGPDKGDRLKLFLYSQLPYHPQRIAKDTSWTVETTQPLKFRREGLDRRLVPTRSQDTKEWTLEAYLTTPISSNSSKAGDSIRAVVAEPVIDQDGTIAVPQGAVMTGTVSEARPARRLGRAGSLVFSFNKIAFPGEDAMSVQTSLKGADVGRDQQLAMDSEGQVKPKAQDKLIVPLILLSLAARPLDEDRGRNMFGKDAVASNSLGVIGFLIGTAAQRPNIAAAIGYYGAALSIYEQILARGKEVAFGRDTRVEIETIARRSTPMNGRTVDAKP